MTNVPTAIQGPRLKLALTYLTIIMGMSVIFSLAIYNISEHELRGQRNLQVPREFRVSFFDDYDRLRELRLEEARENLRQRLVIFNVFTLLIGGILSYWLAVKALRPIEEAMSAQDRFTSDASHEMRTPLTVMRSEIEVALRDSNLSLHEAKDILSSNLEEVQKLEALTTGLLQLAKQENSSRIINEVESIKIINDAIQSVKSVADQHTVNFDTKGVKVFRFSCEIDSFRQALVILLDNAVKYSPKNGTITISAKNGRTSRSIKISDSGAGIHPDDLPHIFERFYRADPSRSKKTTANGYGLGLAIAKQIIDDHGGSIHVQSKLGNGTSFTIQMPKNRT